MEAPEGTVTVIAVSSQRTIAALLPLNVTLFDTRPKPDPVCPPVAPTLAARGARAVRPGP